MCTQHVKDYYDQPASDYAGRYEGERLALRIAHEISLDGGCDNFESVQELGYYCKVPFEGFTVYFCEDEQGFISEISEEDYNEAEKEYEENDCYLGPRFY